MFQKKGDASEQFNSVGHARALEAQRNSPSRRVFIIDGGPANYYESGATENSRTTLQCFYSMLNVLIPSDSGDKIDTLVVTHDDEDHMNGIRQLLISLLDGPKKKPKKPTKHKVMEEFQWQRGVELVKGSTSPFANIWHNSAKNVISYVPVPVDGVDKIVKATDQGLGYFDWGRDQLKRQHKILIPDFNTEFADTKYPLIWQPSTDPVIKRQTNRGHVQFDFIAPNADQLKKVSNFYSEDVWDSKAKKWKNGIPAILPKTPKPADMPPNKKPASKVDELITRLGSNASKTMKKDKAPKNNSSIAFVLTADGLVPGLGDVAKLKTRAYTAVFTGDANAIDTFGPLLKPKKGLPLKYDLMKVMHHGSQANNFLNLNEFKLLAELEKPKLDPQDLLPSRLKMGPKETDEARNVVLGFTYKVMTFFNNVRARKYIISAGPQGHANPHLSTLVGIIARALLFPEPGGVDIYLTNPMHNVTWQVLDEWWFKLTELGLPPAPDFPKRTDDDEWEHFGLDIRDDMEEDEKNPKEPKKPSKEPKEEVKPAQDMEYDYMGKYYRIWKLRKDGTFATVHLTATNKFINSTEWTRVIPDSSGYQKFLKEHYEGFKDKIQPKKPVFKTKFSYSNFGVRTMTRKKIRKLLRKRELEEKKLRDAKKRRLENPDKVWQGAPPGIPRPDGGRVALAAASDAAASLASATGTPMNMLMATATPTAQNIVPDHFPTVPPLKISWETLVKFGLAVGDVEVYAVSIVPYLKTLKSVDELLEYLVLSQAMTAAEVIQVQHSGILNGKWTAGGMAGLLLPAKSAAVLMKTLPYEFITTVGTLNEKMQNPLLWQVSDFVQFAVVDFHASGSPLGQGAPIPQSFFVINRPEGGAPFRWQVPGSASLLGNAPMIVELDGGINITLYWAGDTDAQIIYATFKGHLPNHGNTKVRCEYMVLPNSNVPIRYFFEFVDDNYSNEGFKMPLLDLVSTFGGMAMSLLTSTVTNFSLPGLSDLDSFLDESLAVSEPGFILQYDSADAAEIHLQRVFGTFNFEGVDSWSPFGDIVTFQVHKVKLSVDNIAFPGTRRILLHIYQTINFQGRIIPLEFETRVEPGGGMVYRLSFLDISDYKTALPDFFSDVMDSITLQSFTLGWSGSSDIGGSFSPIPSVVEFVAILDSMTIIPEILDLADMRLIFRISNPSDALSRTIFVDALGTMEIGDHLIDAHLTMGQNPSVSPLADATAVSADIVLELSCIDNLITLEPLFEKFTPDVKVLPAPFDTLVQDLQLDKILLTITKDPTANKYELSMLVIQLSLNDVDINIFDGAVLEDPRLIIRATYPFSKELRDIQVTVDCFVDIAGYGINASLLIAVGANDVFALSINPQGGALPVFAVIQHFSEQLNGMFLVQTLVACADCVLAKLDFDLPTEFGPLTGITLESLYVEFGRNPQGKLRPRDIILAVSSDLNVKIWDSPNVMLDRLAFTYHYSAVGGTDVTFECIIDIGDAALKTTIAYDGPGKTTALTAPNSNKNNAVVPVGTQKVNTQGSWAVTCLYPGTISFFNIIQRLSDVDLRTTLSGNDLKVLREALDINISNVVLTLTKQQDLVSVFLKANTDWLGIFEGLAIAVRKDVGGWGFSLGLSLASNLLSLFPGDFAANFSEYVKVDNTIVAVFLGNLDSVVFPPLATLVPKPSWAVSGKGADVAVSTRIRIDGTTKIRAIGMLLKAADITVVGVIKDKLLSLSVQVATLSLLQDKLKISGSFMVLYDTVLFIGIRSNFAWDLGPQVTKSIVAGSIDFGLDFTIPAAIGLSFRVAVPGPLVDLFDVKGLEVRNFLVQASFPPSQEFVPSLLSLSGAIKIASLSDVSGSIDFLWLESNPSNCYAAGSIQNLDVPKLLTIFARDAWGQDAAVSDAVIKAIKGNGINLKTLAFEIVPHDMVTSLGVERKQKIYFEGNMSLGIGGANLWAGYALIDVSRTNFQILGMLAPLTIGTKELFSITRNPDMSWGWEKNTGGNRAPIPNEKAIDPKILENGPVLQISSQNKKEPIYISGQATLLGQKRAITISITDQGVQVSFGAGLFGAFTFSIKNYLSYSSGLTANTAISFRPEPVTLPPLKFSHRFGGITLPSKTLSTSTLFADLKATYGVAWDSRSGSFWVKLNGTMSAFEMNWVLQELNLKDTVTASDFESLQKIGARFVSEFVAQFQKLLTAFISNIRNDLSRLEPICYAVIRQFKPGFDAAVRLYKDLTLSAESIARMTLDLFNIALRKAQQVINKLKQLGYKAEESMASLKDVFAYTDAKITMTEMLKAGFSEREIVAAARIVFDVAESTIRQWGKDIGMSFKALAELISDLF